METKAGSAISPAPLRIASSSFSPRPMWRSMFSMVTVASSTRIPTASASPPSVIRLIVSPKALSTASEARTERGIEIATTMVLLHEPRKRRIIRAVNAPAITPSLTTPLIAARTKTD